jgi:hypothetical protein
MKINWVKLALNLRRHQSLQRLSLSIGLYRGYLAQLSRGEIKEPKFSDGVRILDLHFDLCGIDKHKKLLEI